MYHIHKPAPRAFKVNITQPIMAIRVVIDIPDWPITRGGGGTYTKQPSCSLKKLQGKLKPRGYY